MPLVDRFFQPSPPWPAQKKSYRTRENITDEKNKADWYEDAAKNIKKIGERQESETLKKEVIDISNFIVGDIEAICKKKSINFSDIKIKSFDLAKAVFEFRSGNISASAVKKIIESFIIDGGNVEEYIKHNNLAQISNEDELKDIVKKVIDANADIVQSYKNGKLNAKSALVGQVMKESKGKANPLVVDKIIVSMLVS